MSNARKNVSDFKHGIKLCPQHFPVGTLFKVDPTLNNGKYKDTVFEASGYVYNSPTNFVVITTNYNEACEVYNGFAYDHIREIIKRGDGPVLNNERNNPTKPSDEVKMRLDLVAWVGSLSQNVCQTHYVDYDCHSLSRRLVKGSNLPDSLCLDMDRLAAELGQQTFVKFYPFICMVAPKKRVNRWFKQNLNRFLIPVKKAQADYDKMMDDIYRQDMESDGFSFMDDLDDADGAGDTAFMLPEPKPSVEDAAKDAWAAIAAACASSDNSSATNPEQTQTEGATSTGRYRVGGEIYAMTYIYKGEDKIHSGCSAPFTLFNQDMPSEVKFIKLVVKEHHKVPIEYSDDLGDGYILHAQTEFGVVRYTNQYPLASYGQVTDTGDRRFQLDMSDASKEQIGAIFENEGARPWQWAHIDDHISSIHKAAHGVDRETMIKSNPELHQKLVDVYKMITETFEAQFPGKQLEIKPHVFKCTDGTTKIFPNIKRVVVVDKV